MTDIAKASTISLCLLVLVGATNAYALGVEDCQKIKASKVRLECFDALANAKTSSTQEKEAATPVPPKEDPLVSSAKQAIEATLKDPTSVQYREIRSNNAGDVCGEFNAKNSYGGYGGFKSFMYQKATGTLLNNKVTEYQEIIKVVSANNEFVRRARGADSNYYKTLDTIKEKEGVIASMIERIGKCEPS